MSRCERQLLGDGGFGFFFQRNPDRKLAIRAVAAASLSSGATGLV